MENSFKIVSELDDIRFKYERMVALVSCLQTLAAEVAEVRGVADHSFDYALCEIELELRDNNERLNELQLKLKDIVSGGKRDHDKN